MTQVVHTLSELVAIIKQHFIGQRLLIALAAPPAAGKSTLAQALVDELNQIYPNQAKVIPMDGFHLDNRILEQRGLLKRKGSPETFDVLGFIHLIQRLKTESEVIIPVFDRSKDLAIAGAEVVIAEHKLLIVEGNYLLLNLEPWKRLSTLWDVTIWIDVEEAVLEQRLIERWLSYGFSTDEAKAKAQLNDLPNAKLTITKSSKADIIYSPIL